MFKNRKIHAGGGVSDGRIVLDFCKINRKMLKMKTLGKIDQIPRKQFFPFPKRLSRKVWEEIFAFICSRGSWLSSYYLNLPNRLS